MVVVGGGAGVVFVVVVVILFILCGRKRQARGPKDKAAEAGAVVVEKKSTSSSTSSVGAVGGLGGLGGLSGGVGVREENNIGGNMSTAMKVMPNTLLSHDNQSTGQESDAKDTEIRTSSSLSAVDRDSDSGWEKESSKASPREPQAVPLAQPRYSVGSTVFTPPVSSPSPSSSSSSSSYPADPSSSLSPPSHSASLSSLSSSSSSSTTSSSSSASSSPTAFHNPSFVDLSAAAPPVSRFTHPHPHIHLRVLPPFNRTSPPLL
ncbi:hypothetical protein GWK47_028835 [Chionoecetes opilio]|uniref:Uncharacterized protein n=1 Tax=Chionoecetes opilio TaxID=41210 RepID=A0A8J4YL30_CHIOP|nr:hypothetical protein GWK47_028835 [Chionoecetes opilio]